MSGYILVQSVVWKAGRFLVQLGEKANSLSLSFIQIHTFFQFTLTLSQHNIHGLSKVAPKGIYKIKENT